MRKLLHYFFHIKLADRLPPLPRMYSVDYERPLTKDEATLMRMSAIRSPHGVEVLKRRHGLEAADQLIEKLPTRPRKKKSARLMPLIRRIFGTTAYDPMKKIYHTHRRRQR